MPTSTAAPASDYDWEKIAKQIQKHWNDFKFINNRPEYIRGIVCGAKAKYDNRKTNR